VPNDPAVEEEATQFAMELLMPEGQVTAFVQKAGGIDIVDDDQVKAMARTFGVSPTLMAFRLGMLYAYANSK
jgi:Zn-dependent peptidase ImmA (M78 family)